MDSVLVRDKILRRKRVKDSKLIYSNKHKEV